MTKIKLDSLAPCYVPCSDDIPKYQPEVSTLQTEKVHDITPSNSEASVHSGATNINRLSTDSDQYSDLSGTHSATSDEFYRQHLAKQSHNANIPKDDANNVDNCDNCSKCIELNLIQGKLEENSETSYLQGLRCDYHSHLMKTTSIVSINEKKSHSAIDNDTKSSENCSNKLVSSPTRSPLSNYDRKRTPSGGSVIKQIQSVIKREEEEVKGVCQSCRCPWQNYIAMVALILANLLNYMDRYTIAGM